MEILPAEIHLTKPRLNLNDAVDDLAPPPPPCFHNRMEWVSYLKSAAATQNQTNEPKVIVIHDGQPRMNFAYPFCADCGQQRSLKMHTEGKCKPNHLKDLAA